MFIQLYPGVVGNYVMRLYDLINLYGRWNSHFFYFILILILFYFILFIQLYPDVMDSYVMMVYDVFNLLCLWLME